MSLIAYRMSICTVCAHDALQVLGQQSKTPKQFWQVFSNEDDFTVLAAAFYLCVLSQAVSVEQPVAHVHIIASQTNRRLDFSDAIAAAVQNPSQRAADLDHILKQFMFVIPQARSPPPTAWCSYPDQSVVLQAARQAQLMQREWVQRSAVLRPAIVRQQLFFPDRQLLQFDCGKLQVSCITSCTLFLDKIGL